jgi:hypothetical protein
MNLFGKKSTDPSELYRPTDGDLSNNQLALSVWLLKHKESFASMGMFALVLWCVVTVGYSTYRWTEYAVLGYWQDKRLLSESASLVQSYGEAQSLYTAQPLKISAPSVITSADDTYDLVSIITNPNTRHVAFVTFTYALSNTTTPTKTIAILPGQKQVAAELGFDTTVYPNRPALRIISTKWQRISPLDVFDVPTYTKQRLRIETTDVSHTPAGSLSGPTDRLLFTLRNQSAYSFYQVNGYIAVYTGSSIVGIRPLTLDRFLSEEAREFDIRFLSSLGQVDNIEFFPLINIFDPNSFIAPGI